MSTTYMRELFPETSISLFMPSINTHSLPSETASHVAKAYREVNEGPRVGIIEERYHGNLPVTIDKSPPYQGVTEFRPIERNNEIKFEAKRVGISDRLPDRKALPNGRIYEHKQRVSRHEFMHLLSEELINYMDVGERTRTIIMESFAEYGDMKARPHKKDEVLFTSPYKPEIKFGIYLDKFYKSAIDGSTGFEAFIKDVQKYKSAKRALDNFGRNIRSEVSKGTSLMEILRSVDKSYQKEVQDSFKMAA